MNKKWLGIGAVVVAVLAWWAIGSSRRGDAVEPTGKIAEESEARGVLTATVEESLLPEWLEATGTVRPKFEAILSAKVMSRVASVSVREGDKVRKGQVLVTLEANDLGAAVDVARSAVVAASAGYTNSKTAAEMEDSMSKARIAQAQAGLRQAEAALMTAKARRDLARAGTRNQERTQAALAVRQAESSLQLAKSEFRRIERLFQEGAVAQRQYDAAKTQYDLAKDQLSIAKEGLSIAEEGTRKEDIQAAEEGVRQAEAAVGVARAAVKEAEAAALQAKVRKQDIGAARAQVGQSAASLRMAQTNRSYATIVAPFDGVVVSRMVDPGSMASMGAPLLTIHGGPLRMEAVVPETSIGKVKGIGSPVSVKLDASTSDLSGQVVEVRPYGDPATHTFLVRVEIPSGTGISSGMFGRARFETGTRKEILIPLTAIWKRDGMNLIYAVVDGRASMRIVMLGETMGPNVEVLSGLAPGDVIVVDHKSVARDGQKVLVN